ncbi:putative NODULIN-LIKE PROTEIN [Salix viminalis]|uniref:NODULIN-LIKE PROTEIN n=1 Tax=Salix viminalis TaxID=40686 RepID=A0A9Q0NM32_SALVM|nr:putative NODULIN-LIKE PROTEIN [Salix viminalis]
MTKQRLHDRFNAFFNDRWLVFVCAMWIQSCAGIGYLFGSISPVIKSTMGYNQRQVAILGVAKDLGDSIGLVPGSLCEVLPIWAVSLIGAVQNFVGYGLVWLIVAQKVPALPLWVVHGDDGDFDDLATSLQYKLTRPREVPHFSLRKERKALDEQICWWCDFFSEFLCSYLPEEELDLCVAIFVGTNGETYFNTVALVSCVQNFPKNRGPVVGILKGFAGLSGAILTQIYAMINSPNEASLIFMIAVGPSMVVIAIMFVVRPVRGHRQARSSDDSSFLFTYSVCLVLAAYLLGVLIVEDLVNLDQTLLTLLAVVLIILVLLPITIPVLLAFYSEPRHPVEENLLPETDKQESSKSDLQIGGSFILSESEDEKPSEMDLLQPAERHRRIAHLQAKLFQAAAEGAVRVKRRKGPRRGEDFTLMQALIKADFLLMFFSLSTGFWFWFDGY